MLYLLLRRTSFRNWYRTSFTVVASVAGHIQMKLFRDKYREVSYNDWNVYICVLSCSWHCLTARLWPVSSLKVAVLCLQLTQIVWQHTSPEQFLAHTHSPHLSLGFSFLEVWQWPGSIRQKLSCQGKWALLKWKVWSHSGLLGKRQLRKAGGSRRSLLLGDGSRAVYGSAQFFSTVHLRRRKRLILDLYPKALWIKAQMCLLSTQGGRRKGKNGDVCTEGIMGKAWGWLSVPWRGQEAALTWGHILMKLPN